MMCDDKDDVAIHLGFKSPPCWI